MFLSLPFWLKKMSHLYSFQNTKSTFGTNRSRNVGGNWIYVSMSCHAFLSLFYYRWTCKLFSDWILIMSSRMFPLYIFILFMLCSVRYIFLATELHHPHTQCQWSIQYSGQKYFSPPQAIISWFHAFPCLSWPFIVDRYPERREYYRVKIHGFILLFFIFSFSCFLFS